MKRPRKLEDIICKSCIWYDMRTQILKKDWKIHSSAIRGKRDFYLKIDKIFEQTFHLQSSMELISIKTHSLHHLLLGVPKYRQQGTATYLSEWLKLKRHDMKYRLVSAAAIIQCCSEYKMGLLLWKTFLEVKHTLIIPLLFSG